MATVILSKAEYLVVLDILHANRIWGLEGQPIIPADRETHLALIQQGIRQLETRGLVKIKRGRHIIERRLLELVAVVVRPQVVITTIRDLAGIGAQLYLHYQAGANIVEQMLPDEDHFSLGQLPDIASAMDRVLRILNIPDNQNALNKAQAVAREHLYQVHAQLESGDRSTALQILINLGWSDSLAREYLKTQANQQMSGLVSLMAVREMEPVIGRDLTLFHDDESTWLLTTQSNDRNQLLVRQVNAATFRATLEETYSAVLRQTGEHL